MSDEETIKVPASALSSKEAIHAFAQDYSDAEKLEAAINAALSASSKPGTASPRGITLTCKRIKGGFTCSLQ